MKRNFFLVAILLILVSCNRTVNNPGSGKGITRRVMKQVLAIAVDYTRDKVNNPQQSVSKHGSVRIEDDQINCVIDPATIVTGLIDSDPNEDAVIAVTYFKGRFQVKKEHLILIRTKRKFTLAGTAESEMKIIGIHDRIIYAEISKYPSDSPAADCNICKEIVKYQFRDGSLARAE